MRVPIRKGGKYTNIKTDPLMTQDKLNEFKKNLSSLKSKQPSLIKEVKRLALMGDFSENAAYQIAKGRLRGLNHKVDKITKEIADAQIIKKNKNNSFVEIGHLVSIKSDNKITEYRILGSSESNPASGTISHQSPLAKVLLNKSIGDIVSLRLDDRLIEYEIINIK